MLSRSLMIAALLAAAISASACETTKRAAVSLRPDVEHPDKFVCELGGTRPKLPAEHIIDWSKVTTVDQAKAETGKLIDVEHTREGIVATYVLDIEGKLFTCSNNMQWQRDYYHGLPPDSAGAAPPAAPRPHHG